MDWITRAKSALGLGRASEGPWGDGFVEEGWDAPAGAADWSTVSADELVFLLPGLRPGGRLPPPGRARLQPLVVAARLRAEAIARGDSLGRGSHAVLSRAEALLAGEAMDWRSAGLVEAAILSFETGLNGAYVVGAADLLGETLAACAWAGIVCRGRDALLAPVLADALRDMAGSGGPGDGARVLDPADAYGQVVLVLRRRLQEARLIRPLQRALQKLAETGRAPVVRGAVAHDIIETPLPASLVAALDGIAAWPGVSASVGRSGTGSAA